MDAVLDLTVSRARDRFDSMPDRAGIAHGGSLVAQSGIRVLTVHLRLRVDKGFVNGRSFAVFADHCSGILLPS
jgi:hypothetical protein